MPFGGESAFQFRLGPDELAPKALLGLSDLEAVERWQVFQQDILDMLALLQSPDMGGGVSDTLWVRDADDDLFPAFPPTVFQVPADDVDLQSSNASLFLDAAGNALIGGSGYFEALFDGIIDIATSDDYMILETSSGYIEITDGLGFTIEYFESGYPLQLIDNGGGIDLLGDGGVSIESPSNAIILDAQGPTSGGFINVFAEAFVQLIADAGDILLTADDDIILSAFGDLEGYPSGENRVWADGRVDVWGIPVQIHAESSAPTDGDIDNGAMVAWLNEGSNLLTFRVRYSGGTLKTGTVALV